MQPTAKSSVAYELSCSVMCTNVLGTCVKSLMLRSTSELLYSPHCPTVQSTWETGTEEVPCHMTH